MKNRYLKVAHFSEAKFRTLVRVFSEDVSALSAAKLCSLNRNTTQRIYTLLRLRLFQIGCQESKPFTGEIEIDESYFGPRRVRGKRGRGAGGKTPVIGLLKRGERVYVKVVSDCSRQELLPVIKGKVLSESTVYTDGWRAYDGLVRDGYKHHRIHHHQNEFARGKNHVNGIESFWSYAKFRLAKLRGVRKDVFLLHLKECEWRFNHRKDDIYKILLKICRVNPL